MNIEDHVKKSFRIAVKRYGGPTKVKRVMTNKQGLSQWIERYAIMAEEENEPEEAKQVRSKEFYQFAADYLGLL